MDKRRVNYVRRQLTGYKENKKLLKTPWCLITNRRLGQDALFAMCIKKVLKKLPKEMREYLRLRYFVVSPQSLSNIAMDLNVSERTLNRWDELIIAYILSRLDGQVYTDARV